MIKTAITVTSDNINISSNKEVKLENSGCEFGALHCDNL